MLDEEDEDELAEAVDLPPLRHRRNLAKACRRVAAVEDEVGDPYMCEDADAYGERWEAILSSLLAAVEQSDEDARLGALLVAIVVTVIAALVASATDTPSTAAPRSGAPPGHARTVRRHQLALTCRASANKGGDHHGSPRSTQRAGCSQGKASPTGS